MKKIILILVLVIGTLANAQITNDNLLTLTIDGSRLIEDKNEVDSGLNIAATFIMLKRFTVNPFVRFEIFPNINYSKFSAGVEYSILVKDVLELAVGIEVGMISRKKPDAWAGFGFATYGFNGDIRVFALSERFPLIVSYNEQWRTDQDLWGAPSKWVGSLFVGIGYSF